MGVLSNRRRGISPYHPYPAAIGVQRGLTFYDSHSLAPKNGETPSPSTLHVAGSYFHYPSPDTDVPSRSSQSSPPHVEFSRNLPLSILTTTTSTYTTHPTSVSPSSPIVTRSSPTTTTTFNVQEYHRSPRSFLRRFSQTHSSGRPSHENGARGAKTTTRRGSQQYYRRATVHGGRLERQRKYSPTTTTIGLSPSSTTFPGRNPQVQKTLKSVGIDDESILRQDKKIRVLCCREDARYCFLVFRLVYMLSCFEEVLAYVFLLSLYLYILVQCHVTPRAMSTSYNCSVNV